MINETKETWRKLVQAELEKMAKTTLSPVPAQVPPKPEMGDLAFPLFAYAKALSLPPQTIATNLAQAINTLTDKPEGEAFALGPYLNVKVRIDGMINNLYQKIINEGELFGYSSALSGKKVMVEFSCPNTNKPLHLGHVRNDCIGQSISSIIKANGAEVMKVNLINNRGVHICKSMLAYQKFGNGETPQSSGIKGDHLVGNYYVRFAQWEKEDPTADEQAQEMLRKWEDGDPEVIELWKKMNGWTLDGVGETYKNTGISFDRYYYESNTYKLGKDKVLEGLDKEIFQKAEDGAVYVDLADIGLDKKILLRKDGTSIYITQDIGTAIERHKDWPFDSLIYVVASEQRYHFKVLFNILGRLGYKWAEDLHHLAYGMVFLPEGKMKSREGTVVDADDLLLQLTKMAKEEILQKGREEALDDSDETARKIALGALNYYMLQFDPLKDIVFNPKESLSFNGNTGPYLQYMGARISSMLRKFDESQYSSVEFKSALLENEDEREMIKLIASYPEDLAKACTQYNPSLVCSFLYDLSKRFSHWYHDNQILHAENDELVLARVNLCKMVLGAMKSAFALIGVPFLDRM